MSTQNTENPYPYFTDRAGNPLSGGKVYFGVAGANPITNPISTYVDSALSVPVSQPVRTNGGYLQNGNSPTRVYVGSDSYSMLVRDANDAVIFSSLNISQLPMLASSLEYATTAAETAASITPTSKQYQPQFDEARRIGAAIDDSTDDGPVLQKLEDLGGRTDLYPGRYVARPTNSSPFDFANTTADVYRSVDLDASGYTVVGFGATLHIKSHTTGLTGGDIQYVYSTDKNTVISQNRVAFMGVSFDSANLADAVNSNHRFAYLTGVRGARYLMTEGYSSDNRRGSFGHLQNCQDVQIVGHMHYKLTQGHNLRFCYNVAIVGNVYNDFSEALDFDGTSRGAVVVGNAYESSSRQNQMWDINDHRDGVFWGACAFNLGNIATINVKAEPGGPSYTPGTFTDYLANNFVGAFHTQRVIVGGITGSQIGGITGGGPTCFTVGSDWAGLPHAGTEPSTDVLLSAIFLQDTSWMIVTEGRNLTLRDITLASVLTPATQYAVDIRSQFASADQYRYSGLEIKIDNLTIRGCDRGGLKVQGASELQLTNSKITGINTSGSSDFSFQLAQMHARGVQAYIDGNYFEGDVNINGTTASIPNWAASTVYSKEQVVKNGTRYYRATSGTGTSAGVGGPTGITSPITDGTVTWEYLPEPFRVIWGRNNRVRDRLLFTGDAYKYTHGDSYVVPIGDLAATGTVEATLFVARRKCYIPYVNFTASANVAADVTNFRNLSVRSVRAGVDASITVPDTSMTGLTAHVPFDALFSALETNAWLEPGDVLYFRSNSAAAGVAITGLTAHVEVLFC